MRKGVDSGKELGEGAVLYYLASKFPISLPSQDTIDPIFNEKSLVRFTVDNYEVFQILFKWVSKVKKQINK